MPTSRKKVIVRRLAGDFIPGYLPPNAFVLAPSALPAAPDVPSLTLDLLDLEGRSLPLPLADVKLICFVREFNRDDPENPERLNRRAFLARPRGEGLWLRLTFTTGDRIEGLAHHDITLLDSLLLDAGLSFIPPDERANTHRIFVPRSAIATLDLLAVIKSPGPTPLSKSRPPAQPTLFPAG